MIGWLAFATIGLAALAALWRFGGIARDVWTWVAVAIAMGAAGYAWQGRPAQPGDPAGGAVRTIELDPELLALRGAMTERFGGGAQWLIPADALMRGGDTGTAIAFIRSGLNENNRNLTLWTALGSALVEHDRGRISPAACFAFDRAAGLVPENPAPWFFRGLAEIRAGDLVTAERRWTRALALTPVEASFRPDIARRLTMLRVAIAQRKKERGGELPAPFR